MNPIAEIFLDTTAILTIVCGMAGFMLSVGLIFFPGRTRAIDKFLSRSYHLKEGLAYFDQTVRNELPIYRHPAIWGAFFIFGSAVTLIFLYFGLDSNRLLTVLGLQETQRLLGGMVLEVMVLTGKMAGVIGMVLGLFLMIAPDRLQKIEKRLNAWIATQPIVDRLDVFNHIVNLFSFRHPILIGSIGLLLSTALLALAIANFF
ncbi:MAG: hypothetical protein PVJ53_12170 [Desulfobacterales bacterium]|jgi:hypothetical protein